MISDDSTGVKNRCVRFGCNLSLGVLYTRHIVLYRKCMRENLDMSYVRHLNAKVLTF